MFECVVDCTSSLAYCMACPNFGIGKIYVPLKRASCIEFPHIHDGCPCVLVLLLHVHHSHLEPISMHTCLLFGSSEKSMFLACICPATNISLSLTYWAISRPRCPKRLALSNVKARLCPPYTRNPQFCFYGTFADYKVFICYWEFSLEFKPYFSCSPDYYTTSCKLLVAFKC